MDIDYHSTKNQEILKKFVDREVIMLASDIVDDLQDKEPNWFEEWDIDNLYHTPCPECGGEMIQKDTKVVYKYFCQDCDYSTDEANEEIREIYEYWFVTNWLAERLKARGEVIINLYADRPIWGRCATGQAIYLDGVIGKIAESQKILEGQKYDWSR